MRNDGIDHNSSSDERTPGCHSDGNLFSHNADASGSTSSPRSHVEPQPNRKNYPTEVAECRRRIFFRRSSVSSAFFGGGDFPPRYTKPDGVWLNAVWKKLKSFKNAIKSPINIGRNDAHRKNPWPAAGQALIFLHSFYYKGPERAAPFTKSSRSTPCCCIF